ncbi:Thiol:disulfide interchange protein DsbD [uncultured archaeon]|nr:Thiol:disulfide interchange protein DsbD [uncultured archaeon]
MPSKKLVLILLVSIVLLSGCVSLKADTPETHKMTLKGLKFNTDLGLALEEAKVQGKPVFVYFRSESCGWCKKFEEETFTNESVIKTLNENFILVSIDVNEQKGDTRTFRVRGTPAEIFLDPDGTEIKRIPGYTETENFLYTINEIIIQKEAQK